MSGVVISGPTGAIGMALIKKCIEDGRNVLAICHRGSKRIKQIPNSEFVKVVEASLDEYCNLFMENKPEEEYDTFIHLAWNGTFGDTRNDMSLQVENIKYTLDACDLAKRLGCNVFLGAGSQAEYGRVNEPLRPDTPTFPENGYGMAKLAAGQMSRIKCEQLGLKHIWARILSVYGPYDGENTMIMSSLRKMLNNEETHFTAGEQMWNYLYSEDAAKLILYFSDQGGNGKIYCIGSRRARPLKEFIREMYEVTECTAKIGLGKIPYKDSQVMCLVLSDDNEYLSNEVPFKVGISNVISNIKDCV